MKNVCSTLTLQFLIATVQFIIAILLDGSKMGQYLHELTKINSIIGTIDEECMNNTIAQRIDS